MRQYKYFIFPDSVIKERQTRLLPVIQTELAWRPVAWAEKRWPLMSSVTPISSVLSHSTPPNSDANELWNNTIFQFLCPSSFLTLLAYHVLLKCKNALSAQAEGRAALFPNCRPAGTCASILGVGRGKMWFPVIPRVEMSIIGIWWWTSNILCSGPERELLPAAESRFG